VQKPVFGIGVQISAATGAIIKNNTTNPQNHNFFILFMIPLSNIRYYLQNLWLQFRDIILKLNYETINVWNTVLTSPIIGDISQRKSD
jgi:hypothetical protein